MEDGSTAVELGEPMNTEVDEAPQDQPPQEAENQEVEASQGGESALVVYQGKRPYKTGEDRLVKRPRWGDKAFDDITIGDVETLVRKCASLEKKVEANADAALQLKELQSQKKALEKELGEVGSDEVTRAKASLYKQFLNQMIWVFPWNSELKEGRSISAFVPNVSPELLKALGGSTGSNQTKRCIWYFDKAPVKPVSSTKKAEQPAGSALVLGANLTLKYVKCHCELQVETTYKFGDPEKAKPGPKKKAGRKGKKAADGEAAEDGEEVEAEDAEDGEKEEQAGEEPIPGAKAAADSEVDALAVGGQ